MKENKKIKALIKAVKALQEDGYKLTPECNFTETISLPEGRMKGKLRCIRFSLTKLIPLKEKETEINQLIESLAHFGQEG